MDDQDYQELEIKKVLAEMGSVFDNLNIYSDHYPIHENDYDTHETIFILQDNFEYLAKRLKLLCITYFEDKGSKRFLQTLESEIEPFYKDSKSLLKQSLHDGDYVTSDLISVYRRHLTIFAAFSDNDAEILKRTGLVYLEHILESTGVIIRQSGKKPKSETEVYKLVKVVCEATFSNAQFLSAKFRNPIHQPSFKVEEFFTDSFQKSVKCYKPDILLPSLNCAIEYKYAEDEKKLAETIEQILVDVKGYNNHHKYKIFYAVFYVKVGIWSRQKFNEVWREHEFPKNWKGIMVEGDM